MSRIAAATWGKLLELSYAANSMFICPKCILIVWCGNAQRGIKYMLWSIISVDINDVLCMGN